MRKQHFSLLVLVLIVGCLWGQRPAADPDLYQKKSDIPSLELKLSSVLDSILNKESLSPEILEATEELFIELKRRSQHNEAIKLYRVLESHRDVLDTNRIDIQRNIASVFSAQTNYDSARHYMEKAYQLSLSNDSFLIKKILFQFGFIESRIGNYTWALKYYMDFLKIPFTDIKESQTFVNVCIRSAKMFELLGNDENANKYLELGLEAGRGSGSNRTMISAFRLAGIFIADRNPNRSIEYFVKAERLMKESHPRNERLSVYAHLAGSYLNVDSLNRAKQYLDLALPLLNVVKMTSPRVNYHLERAWLNYRMGEFSLARKELSLVPDKLNNLQKTKKNGLLKVLSLEAGDFQAAYGFLLTEKRIEDSLYQIRNNQIIFDLEKRYESAKREKEISDLNQEKHLQSLELTQKNNWLKYLIIGLILMGLSSGWIWKLYRDKLRFAKEIEEKNEIIGQALKDKEFLLKEIHHRVKNNLQVISSLFSLQSTFIKNEDALMAINESRDRIKSMTLIHQNLYRKDDMRSIEVRNYFERLTKSLFYSYNISNDRIELEMNIADISLDLDTVMPIGLILNELISNALKYAFPEDQSGTIQISLLEEGECLILNVKDNGIGFDTALVEENSESFGMEMIRAFLQKLEATITYNNNQGTQVELVMKNYIKS